MFQEITIANFNVQRLADYCLVQQIQDRVADAEEPQVLAVFHQQKEYTPVCAQKHDASTLSAYYVCWK